MVANLYLRLTHVFLLPIHFFVPIFHFSLSVPRSLFSLPCSSFQQHLQAACNEACVAVDRKVGIKARENATLACRNSSFSSQLHAQLNYSWRSKKLHMIVSVLVGSFIRKVFRSIMFLPLCFFPQIRRVWPQKPYPDDIQEKRPLSDNQHLFGPICCTAYSRFCASIEHIVFCKYLGRVIKAELRQSGVRTTFEFRSESLQSKFLLILFVHNLTIGCSKKYCEHFPRKRF